MAEAEIGTCEPWAVEADLCFPCSDYTFPVGLLDTTLQVASDLLFMLSGKQFPGVCTATVRPCQQYTPRDRSPTRHIDASVTPYGTPYPFGTCGCAAPRECGCPRPSEISLGIPSLIDVTQVKVDGAIVASSLYRIDDHHYLVRLRDADGDYVAWPCCQDVLLPDTADDTFSVTYTYGRTPPAAGVHAAAILACELALACQPDTTDICRLPRRVQSITRQGISLILNDPFDALENGRIGIVEVDMFLKAYNPHRLTRQATVLSPDIRESVRRIDT